MKPTAKITELRRFKRLVSRDPLTGFHRRIWWPRELLALSEQHADSLAVKYEARRMYIVSLCAAFEIFWRDFMKVCVDEARLSHQDLQHMSKPVIGISDVALMIDQKANIGELVSCSYTFQGCDVIDRAFSEIFRFRPYQLIEKTKLKMLEPQSGTKIELTGEDILNERNIIDRCFQVRHETVHNVGSGFRPSLASIAEGERAMIAFNSLCSHLIGNEIFINFLMPNEFKRGRSPEQFAELRNQILIRNVRTWFTGRFRIAHLPKGILRKPKKKGNHQRKQK
jgi:hypothetical protein